MLIGASLIVILIIVFLNLTVGGDFLGAFVPISVDNEAIVDGVPTTFVVEATDVLFSIDTSTIVGAITIISITLIGVALITGISVLASGLNAQSAKIVILATVYTGLWILLSVLAYSLIVSIEVFGTVIYIGITLAYVIGVIQSVSGGND